MIFISSTLVSQNLFLLFSYTDVVRSVKKQEAEQNQSYFWLNIIIPARRGKLIPLIVAVAVGQNLLEPVGWDVCTYSLQGKVCCWRARRWVCTRFCLSLQGIRWCHLWLGRMVGEEALQLTKLHLHVEVPQGKEPVTHRGQLDGSLCEAVPRGSRDSVMKLIHVFGLIDCQSATPKLHPSIINQKQNETV